MPYLISGVIDSKYVEKKIISSDEILKLIGSYGERISNLLTKNKSLILSFVKEKKRYVGGALQPLPTISMPAEFTTEINEHTYTIRYFRQEVAAKEKGVREFIPRKITFSNNEFNTFYADSAKEEAIFWAIHPNNTSSPLHRPSKHTKYFVLVDKEQEAEMKMKERLLLKTFESKLLTEDIKIIKRKAAGLNLVNSTRANSDDFVRNALLERFDQMQKQGKAKEFIDSYNDSSVDLSGRIYDALALNIITRDVNKKTNKVEYSWGSNAIGAKGPILTVPSGANPHTTLVDYATTHYNTFVPIMHTSKEKQQNAEGLAKMLTSFDASLAKTNQEKILIDVDSSNLDPATAVDLAIQYETIEFDRTNGSWSYVDLKTGELSKGVLLNVKNIKTKKKELIAFLTDPKNSKTWGNFKGLLTKKQNNVGN